MIGPRDKLFRSIRALERAARADEMAGAQDPTDMRSIRAQYKRKLELLQEAISEYHVAVTAEARRDFFHDVLGLSGLGFDEQAATLYKHENNAINAGRTPLLAFFLAVRKYAGFPINTLLHTMKDRTPQASFAMQAPSERQWHRVIVSIVSAAGGRVVVDQGTQINSDRMELRSTEMELDGSVIWEVKS